MAGLLRLRERYVVRSSTPAYTSSETLVDDPEAVLSITLDRPGTVLVVYHATNDVGDPMREHGRKSAINVDGVDVAHSSDSDSLYIVRTVSVWAGQLGHGHHTIKGRFATNYSGVTATVRFRVLAVLVFDGDSFYYIDDDRVAEFAEYYLEDDPYAVVSADVPKRCKALILYNTSNISWGLEAPEGKNIAISVDDVDYALTGGAPNEISFPNNVFTAYAMQLEPGTHTIKGRAAVNEGAEVFQFATIDRRQLAVLLIDDYAMLDVIDTSARVSVVGADFVRDPYASIVKDVSVPHELVAIAVATKRYGTLSPDYGERYGIMVDGFVGSWTRSDASMPDFVSSSVAVYATAVEPGSHEIYGVLSGNHYTGRGVIDSRILIALWFPVAVQVIKEITASSFPMYYMARPPPAQELISKVEGVSIRINSRDYPITLLEPGKANELRSKFVPLVPPPPPPPTWLDYMDEWT